MIQQQAIQHVVPEALPGFVRKRLAVPENHTALLVEGGQVVGQRGPGTHTVGHLFRPPPEGVVLTTEPLDLSLRVEHLRSGDGQVLDLVWPQSVRIADPLRFYEQWLRTQPPDDAPLPADAIAGTLFEAAQAQASQYTLADLQTQPVVARDVANALREPLQAALAEFGLEAAEPATADRLRVVSQADKQAAAEAQQAAEQAVRDARFQEMAARMEDRAMFEQYLADWSEETSLTLDEDTRQRLWAEIERGPEDPSARLEQVQRLLQARVQELQADLADVKAEAQRRFEQMMARFQAREEAPTTGVTNAGLSRLVSVLRLTGATVALVTAYLSVFWSQFFTTKEWLHLVAAAVGFIAALVIFSSAFLVHERQRARRAEAHQRARARQGASQARRVELDRLVRARIEASLQRVGMNLRTAWQQGYGQGDEARQLAVSLREFERQVRSVQDEVQAANYEAGVYLSQARPEPEQLAAMLDLDEDLLTDAQTLAESSQRLYEDLRGERLEQVRDALQELDNGLLALRNRFCERSAFMQGTAT